MKNMFLSLVVVFSIYSSGNALAFSQNNGIQTQIVEHGGGLDRNGCHHDRKSGGYHCH